MSSVTGEGISYEIYLIVRRRRKPLGHANFLELQLKGSGLWPTISWDNAHGPISSSEVAISPTNSRRTYNDVVLDIVGHFAGLNYEVFEKRRLLL